MPLRTYSAGMHTRLAFAVATSVAPDILILDEGIGTVDTAFLAKANARLASIVARAGILVLASHVGGLLTSLCTRAIHLERGRVAADGALADCLERYGGGMRE